MEKSVHHVRLLQGMFQPRKHFSTFQESVEIRDLSSRFISFLFLLIVLSTLHSWISWRYQFPFAVPLSSGDLKVIIHMISFAAGSVISFFFIMFVAAFIFKIFFLDISYKKLLPLNCIYRVWHWLIKCFCSACMFYLKSRTSITQLAWRSSRVCLRITHLSIRCLAVLVFFLFGNCLFKSRLIAGLPVNRCSISSRCSFC